MEELIWINDSLGGNYFHYEGSLVTCTWCVMDHLVFAPHGHLFKTTFHSFYSKCHLLLITSLVGDLPGYGN